jgi:hypothetical protein
VLGLTLQLTVGAVVSSTVTEKVAVDVLPAASVAEQLTDGVPIGKVLPEGSVQVTSTEPSTHPRRWR